jgi:hypothetical protein
MIKNLFYIYIILLIILIILILLFLKNKYFNINYKETFQNSCNKFFKGKTFCQLNKNNNKCECKYQKNGINYPFIAPEPCCDNKCSKIKPEDCHEPNPKLQSSYYCNVAGKCLEYKGTIKNSRISQNNCGLDPLNNQLLLPYITKQECERRNNPCDKYNKLNESTIEKKDFCLKDTNCGFCTNSYGEGKCIGGTASGPNDILKYFYCLPRQTNTSKDNNKYEYGNRALYIL